MRASMIGVRPESIISTLARLTSTPMTLWPIDAKQAAETEPTYPNPKMLTDKPKRILLAAEYLEATQTTRGTTSTHRYASKPFSTGSWTALTAGHKIPVFNSLKNILDRK